MIGHDCFVTTRSSDVLISRRAAHHESKPFNALWRSWNVEIMFMLKKPWPHAPQQPPCCETEDVPTTRNQIFLLEKKRSFPWPQITTFLDDNHKSSRVNPPRVLVEECIVTLTELSVWRAMQAPLLCGGSPLRRPVTSFLWRWRNLRIYEYIHDTRFPFAV